MLHFVFQEQFPCFLKGKVLLSLKFDCIGVEDSRLISLHACQDSSLESNGMVLWLVLSFCDTQQEWQYLF